MSEGFDFGNTRVRARRADLLDAERYRQLAALDVDRMVAALSDSPYRLDIEAATPRHRGLRLLDEALRTNLARTLREVTGWYEGPAGADISLVVGRWDLRNVRAILRGQFARVSLDDIRASLVPAGVLEDDVLGELAAQAGVRPTVELMFVWGVPNRVVAGAAATALPELESTGDFQAFERALERAAAHGLRRTLETTDPEVAAVLRTEIDQANLLTALRLQETRLGPGEWDQVEPKEHFLEGGMLPLQLLVGVASADNRGAAAELLAAAALPAQWSAAVAAWGESGDLVALGDELDRSLTRRVVAMFATSDPLGPGVPLAYMWAKENEVKNLRTIGSGLNAGTAPDLIEEDLVIPL